MSLRLRPTGSVTVPAPAEEVARALTEDPQRRVADATADALGRLTPTLRRWGLAVTTLPTVTAAPTEAAEPGVVRLRWRGDEDTTGWPALSGWLVVTAVDAERSRLTLLTDRPATRELGTRRLHAAHAHRVLRIALDTFLDALAQRTTAPIAAADRTLEAVR